MSAKILQINYKLNGPRAEYERENLPYAQPIANLPGLRWKVWIIDEAKSEAGYFAAEHGPSACGLAFRVRDAHKAYARALELGAQPIEIPTGPMELRLPAIKGIGGAPLLSLIHI